MMQTAGFQHIQRLLALAELLARLAGPCITTSGMNSHGQLVTYRWHTASQLPFSWDGRDGIMFVQGPISRWSSQPFDFTISRE